MAAHKGHQHTQPRSRDPDGTVDLVDYYVWQCKPAQVLLVSSLIGCITTRCDHPRRRNSTPAIPIQAHPDHVLLERG